LLCQITFAQQVVIDQEIAPAFLSVVKDFRKFNICIDEQYGKDGIIVVEDPYLNRAYAAVARGAFVDDTIFIVYNCEMLDLPFKKQKFIMLHEIAHEAGYFHWDNLLAMQFYSSEIPMYYEYALGEIANLMTE
jgi:hypothetical protein